MKHLTTRIKYDLIFEPNSISPKINGSQELRNTLRLIYSSSIDSSSRMQIARNRIFHEVQLTIFMRSPTSINYNEIST